MAEITLHGDAFQTNGDLPKVGESAPDFALVDTDLAEVSLGSLREGNKLIYTIPSIDTPVCETSTKKFMDAAKERPKSTFLVVSADLPFAFTRFFQDDKPDNIIPLSMVRAKKFAKDYGVLISSGPLAGICARAIVVLNADNQVMHTELVSEISDPPDYEAALRSLDLN